MSGATMDLPFSSIGSGCSLSGIGSTEDQSLEDAGGSHVIASRSFGARLVAGLGYCSEGLGTFEHTPELASSWKQIEFQSEQLKISQDEKGIKQDNCKKFKSSYSIRLEKSNIGITFKSGGESHHHFLALS